MVLDNANIIFLTQNDAFREAQTAQNNHPLPKEGV